MRKIIIDVVILVAVGAGAFLLKPDTAKAPENTANEILTTEPQNANLPSFSQQRKKDPL